MICFEGHNEWQIGSSGSTSGMEFSSSAQLASAGSPVARKRKRKNRKTPKNRHQLWYWSLIINWHEVSLCRLSLVIQSIFFVNFTCFLTWAPDGLVSSEFSYNSISKLVVDEFLHSEYSVATDTGALKAISTGFTISRSVENNKLGVRTIVSKMREWWECVRPLFVCFSVVESCYSVGESTIWPGFFIEKSNMVFDFFDF